jgi:hypothetical protein
MADPNVSSSSEEDHQPKPLQPGGPGIRGGTKATSKPAVSESKPASDGAPSREDLVSLLASAATEIKSYKKKVSDLAAENTKLRTKSRERDPKGSDERESTTTGSLKQKLLDLSLENHLAVDQMATLRRRVVELEAIVESQNKEIQRLRMNPAAKPTSVDSIPSRRAQSADNRPPVPPPKSKPHHVDPNNTSRSSQISTGTAVPPASPVVRSYDEMMITRFRRSLAPPPTKEQLGEVVHSMVLQLIKVLKQRGRVLPLTKVSACVYSYPTTHSMVPPAPGKQSVPASITQRKIHLAIDSGRLVVKCGGGHVDILEYLERNKVCISS